MKWPSQQTSTSLCHWTPQHQHDRHSGDMEVTHGPNGWIPLTTLHLCAPRYFLPWTPTFQDTREIRAVPKSHHQEALVEQLQTSVANDPPNVEKPNVGRTKCFSFPRYREWSHGNSGNWEDTDRKSTSTRTQSPHSWICGLKQEPQAFSVTLFPSKGGRMR